LGEGERRERGIEGGRNGRGRERREKKTRREEVGEGERGEGSGGGSRATGGVGQEDNAGEGAGLMRNREKVRVRRIGA